DPELLFLDEPTNGLDPAGRDEMLELIADLPARRGVDVILSTHLLPDVERVCDRVCVVSGGQLAFVGSVEELRGGERQRYRLRVKDGEERLAAALGASGCAVEIEASARGGLGRPLLVRLPDGASTDLVFDAAAGAGVQVRELLPERASLED